MPPVLMRAYRAALEKGAFDRAYLFHGDDDFQKERAVRALIDRATEPATRDFNLEVLRAAEVDAASVALALEALPMMAARRVVVIRDVSALKKPAYAALLRYLKHAVAEIVLVLVAGPETKPDATLSAHTSTIDFKPLDEDDVAAWMSQYMASIGLTIAPRAATLLLAATGSDLALLTAEIDKLRSFSNGAEIDEAAVTAIVGVRHGETVGDLLDEVGARRGVRAIALLEHVLSQPKATGVSVLMALTSQTMAIGWALAAESRGRAQPRLEGAFLDLLKANPSTLVGRGWGEGVKGWARATRHWDAETVERALELLLAADASLKDTRVSTEEQVLTSLVLAMTARGSRRGAA